jgi:hypothetical protein
MVKFEDTGSALGGVVVVIVVVLGVDRGNDHGIWVAPDGVLAEDKVGQGRRQTGGLLDVHSNGHRWGRIRKFFAVV